MSCLDENQLLAFVSLQLAPEERVLAERHLDDCSSCRSLVSLMGKTTSLAPQATVSAVVEGGSVDAPGDVSTAAPRAGAQTLLVPGEQVGRYFVLRVLGAGAMGVVYEAYDPELKREVALKLIRSEVATLPGGRDFLEEARAMARVTHPNVVVVYDAGRHGTQVFVAMEKVAGKTLREWLREPHDRSEILAVFSQVGEGLAAVHRAGLVHRDVKPENALVGEDGRARLSDFGFALDSSPELGSAPPASDAVEVPPAPVELVGTPRYMAPEVRAGQAAIAASDQYSFCVSLYEALHGEPPAEEQPTQPPPSALAELAASPAPASTPLGRFVSVPAALDKVLARGLSPASFDRYPSMEALLGAFPRPRKLPLRSLAASVVVLAILGGGLAGREVVRRQQAVCKGAERKLDGHWDVARRGEVEKAFQASTKPFAAASLERALSLLDGFSTRWVAMHTEACEATRLRGEQSEELLDARMQCLEDAKLRLSSAVDLLREGKDDVVEKAVAVVGALPSLEGCSDARLVRARRFVPQSPEARSQAEALQAQLARALAQAEVMRLDEAKAQVREVIEGARSLRVGWLEAQGLDLLARIENYRGDGAAARQAAEAGVLLAEATGDDRVLVRLWIALGLSAHRMGKSDEGVRPLAHAQAVLERVPGERAMRGHLHYARSVLSYARDAFAESRDQAKLSIEQLRDVGTGPDAKLSDALNQLGWAEQKLGNLEAALAAVDEAVKLREQQLGSEHPSLVALLHGKALVLQSLERVDEAVALLQRALALDEKSLGADAARTGTSLNNLGFAFLQAERFAEALPLLERAEGIYRTKLGADHPFLINTLAMLGVLHRERGDFAKAQAYVERATALRLKHHDKDDVSAGYALDEQGALAFARGRCAQARGLWAEAEGVFVKALDAGHAEVGRAKLGQAEALLCLFRAKEAVPFAKAGLEVMEKQPWRVVDLAHARFVLAKALAAAGREPAKVKELSAQALEALTKLGRPKAELQELQRFGQRPLRM